MALAPSEADDRMDVSEGDQADSPQAAVPSLPADQGVAALGQEQPAGEDEGDDFRAGTGSDEEDDEATLEEEEVRLPHPPCPCALHGNVVSIRRRRISAGSLIQWMLHSCLLTSHARLPLLLTS